MLKFTIWKDQHMIEVQNLSVSYTQDQPNAVDQLSFSVKEGEWVLITGPSGCGKSTLARILLGLIPHSIPAKVSGKVRVAGADPRLQSLAETTQQVGMVFQNPSAQLFHLNVFDEIAFGLRNLGLDERSITERVIWSLEATGLRDLAECVPANLSGGQKQLVAIAAVLAMRPKVMILDEPMASLDDQSVQRVMSTLAYLQKKLGITILMIEHRLTGALRNADRLMALEDGKLVFDSPPQQVYSQPDLINRLGLRKFADKKPMPWKTLIRSNNHQSPPHSPLLELIDIGAGYDGQEVISDVNLSLYPGDFTALVGPNGAGKSTLALVAAGLLKPKRGQVVFASGRRPRPGRDVCLLFQNPIDQLFTTTVDEEISFGPRNYGCFDQEQHQITLNQADLMGIRQRSPWAISVGQQHRTALGACAALRPKVVILDEPTLGQDWAHLQQLMNFLSHLSLNGTAVLLISHDYKLVFHYARTVMLIEAGKVKTKGSLVQKSAYDHKKEKGDEVVYA
jgi:energy-coupling factor transport system ATP-binding protein